MKVRNLFVPLEMMKSLVFGNAEINWLSYPKGVKIHRIVYDKQRNGYFICIHHKDFEEIDIVAYNKHEIPTEDAMMRPIPGLQLQFLLFLKMIFPVLVQDYAQIQSKLATKSVEEQNQTMTALYKMRIGNYFDEISKLEGVDDSND